jgi:hypothetical protein
VLALREEQHLLQLSDRLEDVEKELGEVSVGNPLEVRAGVDRVRRGLSDWARKVREERKGLHPVVQPISFVELVGVLKRKRDVEEVDEDVGLEDEGNRKDKGKARQL